MGGVLLLTASRGWTGVATLMRVLDELRAEMGDDTVLRHGNARGGDRIASAYWQAFGLNEQRFLPDWDAPCRPTCNHRHRGSRETCPAAAIYRDELMISAEPRPTRGVAFILPCTKPGCERPRPHGSHGATYTYEQMLAAGIPTRLEPAG